MFRFSSAKLFVRKNLFRKCIYRRKFSSSSSDVLNVNFVITGFAPTFSVVLSSLEEVFYSCVSLGSDENKSFLAPRWLGLRDFAGICVVSLPPITSSRSLKVPLLLLPNC